MKNMESPIKYEKYDKISDSVLFLGQSTTLRFNVKLSKINSNNNGRYHFHREYKYYNDNYGDLYSIKRDFDYYLSIESWSNRTMYFQMRPVNMISVLNAFNRAYNWLVNEKLWKYRDNTLYLINEPEEIFIYNLYVEHIYNSIKVDIYESSHRILGIFPKLITLILTLCALILAVNIGSG